MVDKACASRAVLGKRKRRVKGSGEYAVCLSPTQQRALFGRRPVGAPIGCGTFACVYPGRKPNEVVKITKDREDVEGLLVGQDLARVVRVRDVKELKDAGVDMRSRRRVPVYAVTAERLQPLSKAEQRWVDRPLRKATEVLVKRAARQRAPLAAHERRAIANRACARASRQAFCAQFIEAFVDAFELLRARGVVFQDAHPGNFGVDRRGRWKILDLGYSGVKKRARVPLLAGAGLRR